MLVVAACSGGEVSPTLAASDSSTSTTTAPTATTSPGLSGFATTTIIVSGSTWVVAVADDPVERAQGLMGITDLGGLDGMLFVFEDDSTSGFWMKDTLIGLDIAFFIFC